MSPVAQQCPCPIATPGAIGAGPCELLGNLDCADFDKAYASSMFNQNSQVIALTAIGIERSTDKNLRDISGEIRTQLTSENVKLRNWGEQMSCGTLAVDYDKAQNLANSLSEPMGQCFDVAYAQTLIGLLEQNKAAHDLAAEKSGTPQLQAQAQFASRYTCDWIFRLQRWINEKGQVPTA